MNGKMQSFLPCLFSDNKSNPISQYAFFPCSLALNMQIIFRNILCTLISVFLQRFFVEVLSTALDTFQYLQIDVKSNAYLLKKFIKKTL